MLLRKKIVDTLKLHEGEIKKRFGLSTLLLYGSYARDTAKDESDIDLLFELPEGAHMPLMRLQNFQRYISEISGIKKVEAVNKKYINPVVFKQAEQDAIVIF